MRFITLNNGTRVRVSPEDHDRLAEHSWGQFGDGKAYRKVPIPKEERVDKKAYRTILMHRAIMGVDDPRKVIFRDGDPTNCTRENLVVKGPRFQPRQRTKKGGSSQYRGVSWNRTKGMWQAYIRVDRKLKHLGFFEPTPEGERKAAETYDEAARTRLGDMAVLNFERKRRRRRVDEHRQRPAPTPAAAVAASAHTSADDLLRKPVHDLTREEMELLKARFLGERYRSGAAV